MRTRLDIDDDVLALARSLAESQGISIGRAISHLARRGGSAPAQLRLRNGFPVFAVEPGTAQFGPDEVQAGMDADGAEPARRWFKRPGRCR